MKKITLKIAALYKTFSGDDWVRYSIESIYDNVDAIYFVHSNVSWLGERGNTCIKVVEDWKNKYDKDKKIITIVGDFQSQDLQYVVGMKVIKSGNFDWVLLVDTDEIWSMERLLYVRKYLETNPEYDAFSCSMFTHIKEPKYIVWPPEPCRPTVLIRSNVESMVGVRGNRQPKKGNLRDVYFNHLTLVRKKEQDIFTKIIASNSADGETHVNLKKWKKTVWDRIPNVNNFHMTKGYEHCWESIKEVEIKDGILKRITEELKWKA